MISFNEDRCQGCNMCVVACPQKILTLDSSRINKRGYTPVIITDKNKCTGCSLCAIMCPDLVIEIKQEVNSGNKINEGK